MIVQKRQDVLDGFFITIRFHNDDHASYCLSKISEKSDSRCAYMTKNPVRAARAQGDGSRIVLLPPPVIAALLRHSSIHHEDLAGTIGGGIGRQEESGLGYFLRPTKAAKRNRSQAHGPIVRMREERTREVCFDGPGTQRIEADVVLPVGHRQVM